MWHCEQAFTEARCALWHSLHSISPCCALCGLNSIPLVAFTRSSRVRLWQLSFRQNSSPSRPRASVSMSVSRSSSGYT